MTHAKIAEEGKILRIDVFEDLSHCCEKRRVLPSEPWHNLAIGFPADMIINLKHQAQLWSAVRRNGIYRPGNVYATSIYLHAAGSQGFRKCSVSSLPVRNLHQSEVAISRQHGSETVLSKSANTLDSVTTVLISLSFSVQGWTIGKLSGLILAADTASSKDGSIGCQQQDSSPPYNHE